MFDIISEILLCNYNAYLTLILDGQTAYLLQQKKNLFTIPLKSPINNSCMQSYPSRYFCIWKKVALSCLFCLRQPKASKGSSSVTSPLLQLYGVNWKELVTTGARGESSGLREGSNYPNDQSSLPRDSSLTHCILHIVYDQQAENNHKALFPHTCLLSLSLLLLLVYVSFKGGFLLVDWLLLFLTTIRKKKNLRQEVAFLCPETAQAICQSSLNYVLDKGLAYQMPQ